MCSTLSPPPLVRVLVSLVLIEYLPRIYDLIVIPQVFSPTNIIFSGIGVLLLVSIILNLSVRAIMTFDRQLRM